MCSIHFLAKFVLKLQHIQNYQSPNLVWYQEGIQITIIALTYKSGKFLLFDNTEKEADERGILTSEDIG